MSPMASCARYILVVEGSIPNEQNKNKKEGYWPSFGTNQTTDRNRREIDRGMQQEILETSAYPEIAYECSNNDATKAGEDQHLVHS
jgi:hypothetical protein